MSREEDEHLWGIYMLGFDDELGGTYDNQFENQIEKKAYSIGGADAIIGDDLMGYDIKRTNEVVLADIRKEVNE